MPIDQTGTQPGLVKSDELKKVSMRCRNEGCDSKEALEMQMPGQNGMTRVYQCLKCKRTFGLQVGGAFNF